MRCSRWTRPTSGGGDRRYRGTVTRRTRGAAAAEGLRHIISFDVRGGADGIRCARLNDQLHSRRWSRDRRRADSAGALRVVWLSVGSKGSRISGPISTARCASRSSVRRQRQLLSWPMRIGVDLGGTKIEGIAIADGGASSPAARGSRRRAATTRRRSTAVDGPGARRSSGTASAQGTVGVGMPGAISPATGLIKNANSTWLNGRPLGDDLDARSRPRRCASPTTPTASRCRRRPTARGRGARRRLRRDPRHRHRRRHRGRRRVLVGANAIAGEWGHNPLPWPRRRRSPGPPCYCGRRGCIETFLSGPALARDYHGARVGRSTARRWTSPRAPTAGDGRCADAIARYEERLARALASVINVLDPDVIVLGGGLSNIDRLYDDVPAALAAIRLLRSRRHAAGARQRTATRAACAARRGCGKRRTTELTQSPELAEQTIVLRASRSLLGCF